MKKLFLGAAAVALVSGAACAAAPVAIDASRILQDIKVAEGATVQVNTVVGTISAEGESRAAKSAPAAGPPQTAPATKESSQPRSLAAPPESKPAPQTPPVEEDHARSSPLVRKIAREHNVDLVNVSGTGLGGRRFSCSVGDQPVVPAGLGDVDGCFPDGPRNEPRNGPK